jgi:hypothetical protein
MSKASLNICAYILWQHECSAHLGKHLSVGLMDGMVGLLFSKVTLWVWVPSKKCEILPSPALSVFKVFFNYYYCCAGWWYVVAFTKALTMCQIYHTWIHPLHCSLYIPSPPIPETVSTGIMFEFTLVLYFYFLKFNMVIWPFKVYRKKKNK